MVNLFVYETLVVTGPCWLSGLRLDPAHQVSGELAQWQGWRKPNRYGIRGVRRLNPREGCVCDNKLSKDLSVDHVRGGIEALVNSFRT